MLRPETMRSTHQRNSRHIGQSIFLATPTSAHSCASRKKNKRYQHLLTNIDTLFINDWRHFFRKIVKLRKNTSDATQMHALRVPITVEAPGTVTSNPNDKKQLLYEFHSGLGRHNRLDRRFDTNHMTAIENEVNAVPLSEVGPEYCEMDITYDEVLASLTKLEYNKAPGLDGILNEALKRGGDPMISAQACFLIQFHSTLRHKSLNLATSYDSTNFQRWRARSPGG
jgi:hypothetical protein